MNSNAITLPVQDLKTTVLPALGRLVSRRSSLPVLQTIRITRTGEGLVTLQATDLDSHAIYNMAEKQSGPALDLLVPFEPLNKLVKGLGKKETIALALDGETKVNVNYQLAGSEMQQSLDSVKVDEFPALPTINQSGFAVGPEFGLAVKQAFECCSSDPSRHVLHGACLDLTDRKLHYVVGTNGRILFSANSFSFDLKKSVILPNHKFLNGTDLMDAGCVLAVEPPAKKEETGWIKLSNPNWTYIIREIHGPFPNWRQVIPEMASPKTVLKLGPAAIRQILEVLPHLPGDVDPDHKVRLKIERDLLRIEGPDYEKEVWTGVSVLDAKIAGKPLTIALNRNFLATALKFDLDNAQFDDELSAMLFQNGGKRMVIMPVRPSAANSVRPAPTPAPTPDSTATASTVTEPAASSSTTTATTPEPEPKAEAQPKENMNTMTASERGNLKPSNGSTTKPAEATTTPSLTDQIEAIKESVKNVGRDLNNLIDAVKAQEKQQRATEREVESARTTLKKLQQVTI